MKFTINIPEEFIQTLVTKEYLEVKLKELLDKIGEKPTDPDPEPEPLKKCKAGPQIKWIKIVTSKRLQVNFWGEEVTQIKFTLKKDNTLVQEGIFNPTNDVPFIDLGKNLTEGTYTLKFEGTLCDGQDTQSFEYKTTTSPPPVTNPGNGARQTLETTFYYNK